MVRFAKAAGSLLIVVVVFLALLEIGLFVAIKAGWLGVELPTYSQSGSGWFWKIINRDFGVWHQPNDSMLHRSKCLNVTYRSNSHGMRDTDVSVEGMPNRVVVLGDSFVEGFGVDYGKRFTELLEREKDVELLNFGTSGGFGPTQSYILYKTFASAFSHDAVLFAILPDNDFHDDAPSDGDLDPDGLWRPYLVGDYPGYTLTYPPRDFDRDLKLDRTIETYLDEFWITFRVIKHYRRYFRELIRRNVVARPWREYRRYAGYYDYDEVQFLRLRYAIEQIKAIAGERDMLVVTIPRMADFQRAEETHDIPPIREDLTALSEEIGFAYIDLMTGMMAGSEPESYFLECDGHWSDAGHAKAAEIISRWDYFTAQHD